VCVCMCDVFLYLFNDIMSFVPKDGYARRRRRVSNINYSREEKNDINYKNCDIIINFGANEQNNIIVYFRIYARSLPLFFVIKSAFLFYLIRLYL